MSPSSEPPQHPETPQKPWLQLVFVLGEAVLQVISSGILFVIISRISGPALLGTYALAYAWLTLSQGIASAGIPEFLLREVGIHGRAAAKHVDHAILLGLGTGVLGVLVVQAGVRVVGYPPYLAEVISIASLALIPAFLNSAARSVFLTLRKMHLNFIAVAAETTIVMVASLYLLLSGYGAIALMVSLVAGKLASMTLSMVMLYTRALPMRLAFDFAFLVRMARTVFTFSVLNMLALVTKRINTIMVSIWASIDTVGHYAAATKILELGLIPGDLFAQLLMTRIAYSFNAQGARDPNRFGHWYQIMFAIIVPACIGVWVFADVILETLFGTAFGSAFWILRLLMIYLLVETADNIMSVILQADHRQQEDANRLAFNPLTNIVLNLMLLPTMGAIGAAIGRVGGVVASTALRWRLMSRVLTPVNWLSFAVKPGLVSAGVAAVCYALGDFARPIWLLGLYVVATPILLIATSAFSIRAVRDLMSFPTSDEETPVTPAVDPMAVPPPAI